ncbi:MAG: DUF2934 domain-containing protein [Candidatus Accumulibacter sp.]|uniref:DUF2934 domain-containing protein n=1 Tax=Accumulibacter sp. TaxID=2053492 RepID=UPI002879FDE1|nr:DUF2934 domain-containing protein [Accumulibacter sp.]MDS4013959.1 DUF2934 domain-containing protein [Accumulibacter sp.]
MEEKTTSKRTPTRKPAASESVSSQPTPSKPTVRKTAAPSAERKTPAKKAAPPVPAEPVVAPPGEPPAPAEAASDALSANRPSPEERYRMIESAAYFIAEKDGFRDCSTRYWALAEQEVAQRLGEATG